LSTGPDLEANTKAGTAFAALCHSSASSSPARSGIISSSVPAPSGLWGREHRCELGGASGVHNGASEFHGGASCVHTGASSVHGGASLHGGASEQRRGEDTVGEGGYGRGDNTAREGGYGRGDYTVRDGCDGRGDFTGLECDLSLAIGAGSWSGRRSGSWETDLSGNLAASGNNSHSGNSSGEWVHPEWPKGSAAGGWCGIRVGLEAETRFGLYKIMFHFEVSVQELIIRISLPRPALPTPLQYVCTTIGQYTSPLRPLLCMLKTRSGFPTLHVEYVFTRT